MGCRSKIFARAICTAFMISLIGCSSGLTVVVVDEDNLEQRMPGVALTIWDPYEEESLFSGVTDAGGEYAFDKAAIPNDTFQVIIDDEKFFESRLGANINNKAGEFFVPVSTKITTIRGYVIDDLSQFPIPECEITVTPDEGIRPVRTDPNGRYIIKSDQFKKKRYVIQARISNYDPGATNATPRLNEREDLENPIRLTPILADTSVIEGGLQIRPSINEPTTGQEN